MENKIARFFRTTGPLRFFLPIGIILIVFGIFMFSLYPGKLTKTVGTVTGCSEYIDTDSDGDEQTFYEVQFKYTVDGKEYSSSLNGYTDPMKKGDAINVYYDPKDPEKISNSGNPAIWAIGMIVLGILAVVYSIISLVKNIKKNRKLDEDIRSAAGRKDVYTVTAVPRDQLNEYYVSFDGKTLSPGYIVEDRQKNLIYEAPMTNNSLIGDRTFTFRDHRKNTEIEHKVGHTVTQTYNNEFFSMSSWFKFDGKNIWDVLHDDGIRIDTDLHTAFPKAIYTISRNGEFLATAETSGKYVHEEDAEQHSVNIPVGRYYYRLWTNSEDISLPFLAVFAISEVEQAVVE